MPLELAERDGPNYTAGERPMDLDEYFQNCIYNLKMKLFWRMAKWVISVDQLGQRPPQPIKNVLPKDGPIAVTWDIVLGDTGDGFHADRD